MLVELLAVSITSWAIIIKGTNCCLLLFLRQIMGWTHFVGPYTRGNRKSHVSCWGYILVNPKTFPCCDCKYCSSAHYTFRHPIPFCIPLEILFHDFKILSQESSSGKQQGKFLGNDINLWLKMTVSKFLKPEDVKEYYSPLLERKTNGSLWRWKEAWQVWGWEWGVCFYVNFYLVLKCFVIIHQQNKELLYIGRGITMLDIAMWLFRVDTHGEIHRR